MLFFLLLLLLPGITQSMEVKKRHKQQQEIIATDEENLDTFITSNLELYKKQLEQTMQKASNTKQKKDLMKKRYRILQTVGYGALVIIGGLSFQCSETNSHAEIKSAYLNGTTPINPEHQQAQGSFAIHDLTKFFIAIVGTALVGTNDIVSGWLIPWWQKRKVNNNSVA